MKAFIAVFLTKQALAIGINPEEAKKCVSVTEVEDANKLLLDPSKKGKIGLPARCRPYFFDIRPEWMGEWYGGHPSVTWSALNELHINPKTGRIQPIRADLLDPGKKVLDESEGVMRSDDIAWPSNAFVRFMLGEENFVPIEKRENPKNPGKLGGALKQFNPGMHPALLKMILSGEADLHYIPLRAPVGADPRPNFAPTRDTEGNVLSPSPWWDELIFRADVMAEAVADPRLSNRPNASYASPWESQAAPEAQEGVEEAPNEEEVRGRYRGPTKPFVAMTGEMVSVEARSETTKVAVGHVRVPHANGLMLCQFRRGTKHVFVLMHIETAKRILGSILADRCNRNFVQRVGGALHLPEDFIPFDLLKVESKGVKPTAKSSSSVGTNLGDKLKEAGVGTAGNNNDAPTGTN